MDWLPTFYTLGGGNVADLVGIDGVSQWEYLRGDHLDGQEESSAREEMLVNHVDRKGEVRTTVRYQRT